MPDFSFIEKLKQIKCIAYDFDGVMTDNRAMIDEKGHEAVFVNRSDGLAISELKCLGYHQVIISTEKIKIATVRAQKLGIDVMQPTENKEEALKYYCKEHNLTEDQVFFIGNDVNDINVMRISGLCGAPKDAWEEVLELADWISGKNGGEGVIRDFYAFIKGVL